MAGDDVFPDRSMALRDKIAWMVETSGWALEPVAAQPELDPPIPGYSYTIGFEQAYGFPEVCVVGLTPVASRGLVGLVADLLAGGTDIPIGDMFTGLYDGGLRSALLPVDVAACASLFESATAWYGGLDYRVVQLAWPDRNGWMPWEPGFDRRVALAQLVLGDPPV